MSDLPECATQEREIIEETVTVARVADGWAWLEGVAKSACGGCASAGACSTGVLAGFFADRRVHLCIRNDFDAHAGEKIVIGLDPQALTRASSLAYLLPAASMVGAATLAGAAGVSDTAVALASLSGLGAGLYITSKFASRRGVEITPVYLRRAGGSAPGQGWEQIVNPTI